MAEQSKVSLFEMAEAVGLEAASWERRVDVYARDNPGAPLPPTDNWWKQRRAFSAAHLTLALLALDEDSSRKFVASIMARHPVDAQMLMMLIAPEKAKTRAA